ncbi:MAG: glycosyltransferase family protein, partial [Planctomycetota bacterium]
RAERQRILLLATVPPRDDRPDAVALHLTGRTYARMLRMAFAAVAEIDGAELIVKLHPRSGDDPVVRAVRAEFDSVDSRLVRRGPLEKWLAGASCVLSCGSSAGVEATLAGVPVIQLAPPGGSGFLPHDRWGLAGTARNRQQLRELLARLAADGWPAPPGPNPGVFAGFDRPAAARIADEVLTPIVESGVPRADGRHPARGRAARQALPAGYCETVNESCEAVNESVNR